MIQCVYKVRETKPRSRKKDLKNKYVRVKYDKGKINSLSDLGHIIKDDWMSII